MTPIMIKSNGGDNHWEDQERDESGRWTSGGVGSGSDSDPGYKGKHAAPHISWHDKNSTELEGLGAGNFREFQVDKYHPKEVDKFTHAEAYTSYHQLIQTARARLDSSPYRNAEVSFREFGTIHDDPKSTSAMPGFENHHAWPHSFGGTDHSKNLVWLTPAEHVVAHHLLSRMLTTGRQHWPSDISDEQIKAMHTVHKGFTSAGLDKPYSYHGDNIDKSTKVQSVIAQNYQSVNEKDTKWTPGRNAVYAEPYPHKDIPVGSFSSNKFDKLSLDSAVKEFSNFSEKVRSVRSDILPGQGTNWVLNGQAFGMNWAVSKFLTPQERDKWEKHLQKTVWEPAKRQGEKDYAKAVSDYTNNLNRIARETFEPLRPGGKYDSKYDTNDFLKNPGVAGRSEASKERLRIAIANFREENPKPNKTEIVAGAAKRAEGYGVFTYEEAARQFHLASEIAKNFSKNKSHIDKMKNKLIPAKDYSKDAAKMASVRTQLLKMQIQKDKYAKIELTPDGGRRVVWLRYSKPNQSSNKPPKKKKYFRIELNYPYFQKYDEDQPRDENGQWTSGGGGGGADRESDGRPSRATSISRAGAISTPGGSSSKPSKGLNNQVFHAPMTALVKRFDSVKDLTRDSGGKTLNSLISRSVGTKGTNLQSIYARISHATGLPQGKELSGAVDRVLKDLDREGKLDIKLVSVPVRYGQDEDERWAGKLAWERDPVGDWQQKTMDTYQISIKGSREKDTIDSPHTLGSRPHKFDPLPGSLAEKALEMRREEFPDTRFAPQGRYHSSAREAPEMMFGDDRHDLLKAGKISERDAKETKFGAPIGADKAGRGGRYIRSEYYHDKGRDVSFYDATSSVTAHIGAMTGDEASLKMSKLLPSDSLPAHHELAKSLGVKEDATSKPYYTVLSNLSTGKSLEPSDFEGLKDPGALKKAVKAIWTPGSYGSLPNMGRSFGKEKGMGWRVVDKLVAGGMSKEIAAQTAQKMLDNFKETELYKFTPNFKQLMKEAPENFVYTNPMSGFRMSFNKYDEERHRITLSGKRIETKVASQWNKRKSLSGSAALFIQNWDAAAMSDLMRQTKSPYTVHDAIGIDKKKLKELNAYVAKTMQKVQDMDPLADLAKQIIAQHKANKASAKDIARVEKNLEAALKKIRKSTNRFKFSAKNNHFAFEG